MCQIDFLSVRKMLEILFKLQALAYILLIDTPVTGYLVNKVYIPGRYTNYLFLATACREYPSQQAD